MIRWSLPVEFLVAAILLLLAAHAPAADEPPTDGQSKKADATPEQAAWEKTLTENLGPSYLPGYKRAKAAGQETAWDFVADDPKLPRVLLIGDSVSRGYTLAVRHALAGKVNVHRAPANCGPTSTGLKKLDVWLGDGHWDLIHFNFGLHERKTPPADYEKRLEQIVERLEATGARLIWASTTPVSPGTGDWTPGKVEELNAIAQRVMQRHAIVVDDLYATIKPALAEVQNPKDVHFTAAGYEKLGQQVAASIRAALKLSP